MFAKFALKGFIDEAVVKIGQKSGKEYGRITIATGRTGVDFFVEPGDINQGVYKKGDQVEVTGRVVVGNRGLDLEPDEKGIRPVMDLPDGKAKGAA